MGEEAQRDIPLFPEGFPGEGLMTHYRLTLTKGRGSKLKMIAERHSYSKTPPSGWWRSVKLLGSSIHVRMCWTPDEACDALAKPGGAPDGTT